MTKATLVYVNFKNRKPQNTQTTIEKRVKTKIQVSEILGFKAYKRDSLAAENEFKQSGWTANRYIHQIIIRGIAPKKLKMDG